MKRDDSVWVAVGVLADLSDQDNPRVLIAKRPIHLHQGSKWEFPGGKVEPGESVKQALVRELKEELGIIVNQDKLEALVCIQHLYPDKHVKLDAWLVWVWEGEPSQCEGQGGLEWVSVNELDNYHFPRANVAIIDALHNYFFDLPPVA